MLIPYSFSFLFSLFACVPSLYLLPNSLLFLHGWVFCNPCIKCLVVDNTYIVDFVINK